jgi:hypothetical protein
MLLDAESSVGLKAQVSSPVTGRLVRNDSPRFPRASPLQNRMYCTTSGRSNPSSFRRSRRAEGEVYNPSMASAGSPGANRIAKNTIEITTTTTGTRLRTRRARYPQGIIRRLYLDDGSRASRNQSPRKLKPKTVNMMAIPGNVAIW